MKVLFENSRGDTYEVAEVDTIEQGVETIKQFCKEKKFEIHYIRSWEYDCVVTVDVGSHTELFYIVTDEEEYKRINNDKRLTQEEAIELAHGLSHTLAKVGIDVKDTDELLKSLEELIKELVKTNR